MGTSDNFCLRWDSRWDTFAGIKDYNQFHDCTLLTDDVEANSVELRAHKVVLSACSEFFANILTKELMCAHPNPIIYIRGISTQNMQNILHFIYNGEVNMARKEVDRFLEVAESLKIKGLMKGPIGILDAPSQKDDFSSVEPPLKSHKESEESLQTKSSNSKPLGFDDFEANEEDSFNLENGMEFEAENKEGVIEPGAIEKANEKYELNGTHGEEALLAESSQAAKNSPQVLTNELIMDESGGDHKATSLLPFMMSPCTTETDELASVDTDVYTDVMNDELNQGNAKEANDEKEDGVPKEDDSKGQISGSVVKQAEGDEFQKKNEHDDHNAYVHKASYYYCNQCPRFAHTKAILKAHIEAVHENELADVDAIVSTKEVKDEGNIGEVNDEKKEGVTGEGKSGQRGNTSGSEIKPREIEKIRKENKTGEQIGFVYKNGHYYCKQCPQLSYHKSVLVSHIDIVHKKIKKHICKECGHKAAQKSALEEHIESVHIRDKKYPCELCPYKATCKKNLRKHMLARHEKIGSYECKEHKCDYVASLKSKLKLHMFSIHKTGDRIFKCEQCPYVTIYKSSLNSHVKGVHDKIKNHVCEDCGNAFAQKGTLDKHRQLVHKIGAKELKCEKCNFTSFSKEGIIRHIKVMHEEKKLICEDCGFGAVYKADLERHRICVHKIGEKMFKCEDCDYASYTKTLLKQHREMYNACSKRNSAKLKDK